MIDNVKGLPKQSVQLRVKAPKAPDLKGLPQEVEVQMTQGLHDMVEVIYGGPVQDWDKVLASGAPITVNWKTLRGKYTFYGYVSHVVPTTDAAYANPMKIIAMAASHDLRETGTKTWKKKTASQIATDIAKQFKYKPIVKAHKRVYTTFTMNGQTYWEALTRLAHDTGFVLRQDGMNLIFMPLDEYLKPYFSQAPYLQFKDRLHSDPLSQRTMQTFIPLSGEHTEDQAANEQHSVTYIDPRTGKSGTIKEKPGGKSLRNRRLVTKYTKHHPNVVAHDKATATYYAKGKAEQSRQGMKARAIVQGDPRLTPYRPVYVDIGKSPHTGWWLVKSVQHLMKANGEYICELELTTDGLGKGKQPPPKVPYRDTGTEGLWSPDRDMLTGEIAEYVNVQIPGLSGYANGVSQKWQAS